MGDFKNIGDIPVEIGKEKPTQVEKKESNTAHILEHANIPKRYKHAKLEATTEEQQKLVDAIRANVSNRAIGDVCDMLILGDVGTGKTHILIGLLNRLSRSNVYCRYATEYQLLELYFRKEFTKFDGFRDAMFLVIDEIGKRELVDWQKIQIEELISHRYNKMLPTIFITNLTVSEFKKFVGDRISDRMRDNKVIRISLKGESLRGQELVQG